MTRHLVSSNQEQHGIAIVLMCVAGFGWALSSAITRFVPQDMPVQQLVWARYVVHLLLLLLFVWPRKRAALWKTERPVAQVARGLTMLVMPGLFVVSVAYLPVNDVWAVIWTAPIIAAGFAVMMLGEKPSIWQWLALALCFAGIAFSLGLSLSALSMVAVLLPLGSGLAFAGFQVMSRNLRAEPTSTGLFYTALCVVVPLTLVPGVLQRPSAAAVAVALGMGLSWLLVLVSIDEALKRAPLTLVAPFLYSALLWTIPIEWLIFDETISRRTLAGATLVTAGCVIGTCIMLHPLDRRPGDNPPKRQRRTFP
jgi:drug/metabolite transporter (DMT)-like permease